MAKEDIKTLRDFPSVEELLENKNLKTIISAVPRPIASDIIRAAVKNQKDVLQKNKKLIKFSDLLKSIRTDLSDAKREKITQVINATGTLIHTNLGRAPLGAQRLEEISNIISGYCNIEYDLISGKRGNRGAACERYLAKLSQSESAAVVNNCAAALMLSLNSFADKKKVIISRGELIQIGGGFRIPDILKKSGAKLVEVGTTNITGLNDYKDAIDDKTAVILRVHRSNFTQSGFTDEVPTDELAKLSRDNNLIMINDVGSGLVMNSSEAKQLNEPTIWQAVKSGADLTLYSGDKLFGSVQAGIICGNKELIKKLKSNPIFRTLRADKLILKLLESSAADYLNSNQSDSPLWQMIGQSESELYKTGKAIVKDLSCSREISVEATTAYIGGGTTPEKTIPSVGLFFSSSFKPDKLLKQFRNFETPVIGRIENKRFILDLRTVLKSDLAQFVSAIKTILKK